MANPTFSKAARNVLAGAAALVVAAGPAAAGGHGGPRQGHQPSRVGAPLVQTNQLSLVEKSSTAHAKLTNTVPRGTTGPTRQLNQASVIAKGSSLTIDLSNK